MHPWNVPFVAHTFHSCCIHVCNWMECAAFTAYMFTTRNPINTVRCLWNELKWIRRRQPERVPRSQCRRWWWAWAWAIVLIFLRLAVWCAIFNSFLDMRTRSDRQYHSGAQVLGPPSLRSIIFKFMHKILYVCVCVLCVLEDSDAGTPPSVHATMASGNKGSAQFHFPNGGTNSLLALLMRMGNCECVSVHSCRPNNIEFI